jgi:naphthoate synthase
MLPTLEIYESIDRLQKPVIAMVNGFAVGGGQVLQVMCDITIAKESAVFRQVGPMMGSFDAGYGTWYLEDLVGKKKAKEMWFANPKLTAREALENRPSSTRWCRTTSCWKKHVRWRPLFRNAVRSRSPRLKAAFTARHGGVGGLGASLTTCCCGSISTRMNPRNWALPCARSASRIRTSSDTGGG